MRTYLLSPDTIGALIGALLVCLILPAAVPILFAKDILEVGCSILSIIFSVFFAAMAFLISTPDNDFVQFMEEDGSYTSIINTFLVTLASLFIALLITMAGYAYTSYLSSRASEEISKYWIVLFTAIFCYSMAATALSTKDAIIFSKYRVKFMQLLAQEKQKH